MFVVLAALLAVTVSASPSCLDENGKPVDWYVALKHNSGEGYYMFSSNQRSQQFSRSQHTLAQDSNGALVRTIKQIYGPLPKTHAFVLYNDQTDDGRTSASKAHAKGVVLTDDSKGFWLIHSMPKFPSKRMDGYGGLPDTTFAQSFMCVTFKVDQFPYIAAQINLMYVLVYDSSISGMAEYLPDFTTLIDGTRRRRDSDEYTSVAMELVSAGGQKFVHFGKTRDFDGNLFEDVVAPGLKDDIFVETWMNGNRENQMNSVFTTPYSVIHVKQVTMPDGVSWSQTQDHSKWTVANRVHSACVGDINRQKSQDNRGGGMMCALHGGLASAMRGIISDSDAKAFSSEYRPRPTTSETPDVTQFLLIAVGVAGVVAVAALVAFKRMTRPKAMRSADLYVALPKPVPTLAKHSTQEKNVV